MTHLNVPIYISKDLTPSEQLKAFELRNQLRNHRVGTNRGTLNDFLITPFLLLFQHFFLNNGEILNVLI